MTSGWHRLLARALTRLAFHRVTVLHPERLPKPGPTLYLALHRNGAVDGFVYSTVLPRATFMISTQLRRSFAGRLLFSGIEVVRGKDEGDRGGNEAALDRCREHLAGGGELVVFPEGTSSLGPRHLPFKSGAARLLLDLARRGIPLNVVPLGITYESPTSFRSNVEIVVGLPISLKLPAALPEMKGRIAEALEDVGVNVESQEYQEKIQKLAYASTLGTPRSYHESLKALEHGIPGPVEADWRALEADRKVRPFTHQGVPLVPIRCAGLYLAAFALLAPIVLAGGLLNFLPLAGAWLAGKNLADDRNVITFWRLLAGTPLLLLWILGVAAASVVLGQPLILAGYLFLTFAATGLYYRVKKLSVAVGNSLLHRNLRQPLLTLHRRLLEALPHEAR
ncbi:MAG: 1-acyl-sn-glycerol-3-phosphate acyltransferase [Planctomycetes bacterium]|nr:1-acyl-sn-glycerol-3-phosphate acyltransferase [Planctomycetota bacterium]